jgi:hypothetical protein
MAVAEQFVLLGACPRMAQSGPMDRASAVEKSCSTPEGARLQVIEAIFLR